MSSPWALSMPPESAPRAGPLRLRPGISAGASEGLVWLRGDALDGELERALRKLPDAILFGVLEDGQLLRPGRRIPEGTLPETSWKPLGSWLRCEAPRAAFPGSTDRRAPLRLVPSALEESPGVLVCALSAWARHATRAPSARLRGLLFAADDSGRAVVWSVAEGAPLPPLPGIRYVEERGVARPCGTIWSPEVAPALLARWLGLEAGELALLASDGSHERIRAGELVVTTRSAVRLTMEGHHGERP